MVVAPKEVSSLSIFSANEKYVDNGNSLFGNVRDRSLSYLDINVQRQSWCGFDSIRKFGRPRQQISDCVDFADSTLGIKRKDDGEKHLNAKGRYHFGQCLVLPKISTLPPKGYYHRNCDRSASPKNRIRKQIEQCYSKSQDMAFYEIPQEVNLSGEITPKFDSKMYRWTEVTSNNYLKNSSHRLSAEFHDKINGQIESKIDFGNWECDEAEAQGYPKCRRDSEKSSDTRDEYYYQSAKDGKLGRQDFDEVRNDELRIPDIRNDWKIKLMKENEEKQLRAKHQTLQMKKSGAENDLIDDKIWIKPTLKSSWKLWDENTKNELHRSKSTPDMLEGIGERNLEVWIDKEVPKKNKSVTDVYGPDSQVYNDQQEADSLNDPISLQEPVSSPGTTGGGKFQNTRFHSGKNFFSQFLNSRGTTPTEMFANTEPFSQFWVTLSNIYGQTLVLLMLTFSLTEVMDNSVKLLSLQGIFLMYLYVGSIAVIICIYIWVLIDSCSSIQSNDGTGLVPSAITTSIVHNRVADFENISTTKFGSLKKAHIARDRTSNTSFYLRIGAIAFGLGTLVFNGLEMAMHSMMERSCLNDVVFVHPILHGLFTFLQMHFLFVNSQVLVERFGLAARFGFMHLAATNLALWIRLIIWESGNEWTYYIHLSQSGHLSSEIPTPLQLRGFPKFITRQEREVYSGLSDNSLYEAISKEHISQVVSLHQCLNSNSLGQLWTSSMPFLYPFIIQFSIIAAAVTYIMGQNVAKDHLFFQKQKKTGTDTKNHSLPSVHNSLTAWSVDCGGASKGLFLGILCLVAGIVVIIIFLVVKENEDFPPETIFWLTAGTLVSILSITTVMNVIGLIQIRKLSVVGTEMTSLDKILSGVSILGVQLYAILGIIIGASGIAEEYNEDTASPMQKRHGMLLALSLIQLIQTTTQSTFVVEGIRRTSLSRTQALTRPARQVVTFLIFSNAVLWAFDTFVVQSWISQELQLRFFGVLAWGVVSRIALPLLVFFRFHSCVLLLEIWKKSYHSLHIDPGN